MTEERRIKAENLMIWFIGLSSTVLFLLTFFPSFSVSDVIIGHLEMGKMAQRAFSVVLLTVSFQLMKRERSAWGITLFILILNVFRGLYEQNHPVRGIIMAFDIVLIALLLYFRDDFCCSTSKKSKEKAVGFILLSVLGVLLNAAISFHYMRSSAVASAAFSDSLFQTIGMIFGMGSLNLSHEAADAESVVFFFSWGCVLTAVIYAAKPWIETKRRGSKDLHHARILVNLYGQNPECYLTLEEDKNLFFGNSVDGVIPYGAQGGTIIVTGDPICADEDFPVLLKEFKDFCRKTAHKLFILNVTDKYLEEYKKQGFGCVFCGEEARFKLSEYELSGKKGAKMRMNINHATKAGVTVKEYKVLEKRDEFIENEFNRITNEWLEEKKGAMLNFTIGTVGLEDPMDKRYFYALNADGKIVAFVVFVPFLSKNAYMADITRHGKDAPGGVIETITYTAFNVFKEEGVEYGSLGVAPLAGLPENSKNPVEKLLKFVYDHLNECYGFKDLYRAKEKYSPTQWCPSYYVYLPKIPTPDMFYAIVKIQNPQGVFDYVRSFVSEWEKRHKNNEKKS